MGARSGVGVTGSDYKVGLLNMGRRQRENGMRSAHIVRGLWFVCVRKKDLRQTR